MTAALDLAADLHRDDRRVREPYLNHLLRVAIRLMHHYQVRDVDVIVAGLLHDAVEDHPAELADGGPGTDRPGPRWPRSPRGSGRGWPPWSPPSPIRCTTRSGTATTQYREHLAVSLDREPWARVIKVSDFTDNGVGVIHTVGPKVVSSARKYRPLVPLFRDLIGRPDTPLSPAVKRHIFGQLDLAEERFSAILDQPASH